MRTFVNNCHKYFHIGPVEEKWGFYVNTAGYTKINPNSHYPLNKEHPQNHSFNWDKGRILSSYYLVFICKGQGVFESAYTDLTQINEGTCFFLYPGVWHRYKPNSGTGWEEYWIGFNGAYPNDLMHKGFFTADDPCIYVGLNSDLLNLFQKLIETIRFSSSGYNQIIAGIALQILGVVNSISIHKGQENDPIGILISKAKFLLQESLDKSVDMEILAKNLPMGYSAFRKAFKEKVGVSPNQYHLNLRLNRAKNLLSTTTLRISEVAYLSGFDSLFYFSKLFKNKNGQSPKSYRKRNILCIAVLLTFFITTFYFLFHQSFHISIEDNIHYAIRIGPNNPIG
ncbi:MAG: AraC family transcriptional regulator [Anditalea sp.]